MKLKNNIIWLLALLLIVPVAMAINHYKIKYSITSKGLLYPGQEWILSRTTEGNLIHSLKDNIHNSISEYTVTEFQRGDFASFSIFEDVFEKGFVEKGDTIGIINSQNERGRQIELMGELNRQKKLLSVYSSGERDEEVSIAFETMVLARQEMEAQQQITERNRIMFERAHISEEEYEQSLNEYNTKKQNFLIARSQHQALLSGAKKEQLEYVEAHIAALEKQIGHLDELMEAFTITSPVKGKIVRQQGVINNYETILRVAATDHYVLMVPVDIYNLPFVRIGQEVLFSLDAETEAYEGKIMGIDNAAQIINGRQKIFVIVLIEYALDNPSLYPNMMVDVTIPSEPLTVRAYIARLINEVYNN